MDKEKTAYDSEIAEKAKTPLARKLQDLIPDGKSVKKLADHLGVSVQAVNQYKQGVSLPSTKNLIGIADYYGISVDYLLDLTSTPNRDTKVQSISDMTGLSVDAIIKLHDLYTDNDTTGFSNIVSLLIEDSNVKYFLAIIRSIISYPPGDKSELLSFTVDGQEMKLYEKNLLQATLQTHLIENLSLIAEQYSKRYGRSNHNGKKEHP